MFLTTSKKKKRKNARKPCAQSTEREPKHFGLVRNDSFNHNSQRVSFNEHQCFRMITHRGNISSLYHYNNDARTSEIFIDEIWTNALTHRVKDETHFAHTSQSCVDSFFYSLFSKEGLSIISAS